MSVRGLIDPRIVIIEDQEGLIRVLRSAARLAHASVIVRTGTLGGVLEAIATHSANTLVGAIDVETPEGRGLVGILRDPRRTPMPNIVVVSLTDVLSRDQAVRFVRAGIDQLVVPPHTSRRIAERILFAHKNAVPRVVTQTYVGPCRRRAPDTVYDGPRRRATELNAAETVSG